MLLVSLTSPVYRLEVNYSAWIVTGYSIEMSSVAFPSDDDRGHVPVNEKILYSQDFRFGATDNELYFRIFFECIHSNSDSGEFPVGGRTRPHVYFITVGSDRGLEIAIVHRGDYFRIPGARVPFGRSITISEEFIRPSSLDQNSMFILSV
jgi:hypothetical protein